MKYIPHPARTVTALDNYMLLIEYCEGVSRLYDVKPLFRRITAEPYSVSVIPTAHQETAGLMTECT